MRKKSEYETIKNYINNLGYELVSNTYKDHKQKLILKDTFGYLYIGEWRRIKNNVLQSKFSSYNPYLIDNVKLYFKLMKMNLTIYKYDDKSKIFILVDDDGYFYSKPLKYMTYINGMNSMDKFSVKNSYTIQNIRLWCKLNNKPFELISDRFSRSTDKLKWKCLKEECEEIFKSSWHLIYSGGGCGVCHGKQVGLSNSLAFNYPNLIKEWHPTLNGDLTSRDVTQNSNVDVWWLCQTDLKHEWHTAISSRTFNNSGCPYCSGRYPTEENNLLVCNPNLCEDWDYVKNKKSPKEYTPKSGQYVWWKCNKCGNEWYAQIDNRNKNGCPECSSSKGEKECKRVFISKGFIETNQNDYNKFPKIDKDNNNNNVYFIPQKTFNNLFGLGNGLLSYDFYIPQYNCLIEYQGQYHDGTVSNQTQEQFEYQQEHDRRKREYAENNNIKLLEIWYWDFDIIEEILSEFIGQLSLSDG